MKHLFFVICIGFCLLKQNFCFAMEDDEASDTSSVVKVSNLEEDQDAWDVLAPAVKEIIARSAPRLTKTAPEESQDFALFRRLLDHILSTLSFDFSSSDLAKMIESNVSTKLPEWIESALAMTDDTVHTLRSKRGGDTAQLSQASSVRSEQDAGKVWEKLNKETQSLITRTVLEIDNTLRGDAQNFIVHFLDVVDKKYDPDGKIGFSVDDLVRIIHNNEAEVKLLIGEALSVFKRAQEQLGAGGPLPTLEEGLETSPLSAVGSPLTRGTPGLEVVPWSLGSVGTDKVAGGATASASGRPAPNPFSTPDGGRPGTGGSDTDTTPEGRASMSAGTGAPLPAPASVPATAAVPVSASAAPPPAAGASSRGRSHSVAEADAKAKRNSGSGSGAGYQAPTFGADGTVTPPNVTPRRGGTPGAGYGAAETDKVPASPGQGEDTVEKNLLANPPADPSTAPKKKDGCCSIL